MMLDNYFSELNRNKSAKNDINVFMQVIGALSDVFSKPQDLENKSYPIHPTRDKKKQLAKNLRFNMSQYAQLKTNNSIALLMQQKYFQITPERFLKINYDFNLFVILYAKQIAGSTDQYYTTKSQKKQTKAFFENFSPKKNIAIIFFQTGERLFTTAQSDRFISLCLKTQGSSLVHQKFHANQKLVHKTFSKTKFAMFNTQILKCQQPDTQWIQYLSYQHIKNSCLFRVLFFQQKE
ncbi:hypothetical protein ABPG72_004340 [Tetrahymena utriculariae]